MTGGQVAALMFAILLLLPGGCFFILGVGLLSESDSDGSTALLIGIGLLAVMGLLFWIAFRKDPPPTDADSTSA